jgi:hypothetical protein
MTHRSNHISLFNIAGSTSELAVWLHNSLFDNTARRSLAFAAHCSATQLAVYSVHIPLFGNQLAVHLPS